MSEKFIAKTNLILALLTAATLIGKAIFLSNYIFEDWSLHFTDFFHEDSLVLSAVFLMVALQTVLRSSFVSFIGSIFVIIICSILCLDAGLTMAVNARFSIADLVRFIPEYREVLLILGIWPSILMIFFLIIALLRLSLSKASISLIIILSIAFQLTYFSSAVNLPTIYHRYTENIFNILLKPESIRTTNKKIISSNDRQFYKNLFQSNDSIDLPATKPNIILLIVESLSASDSFKVSGLKDRLPIFDQLATEGHLFTNFFANHEATEGGVVSLLSGVPPIFIPGSTYSPYHDYSDKISVVKKLKQVGYYTEFLSPADLIFLGKGIYLRGTGFDQAGGFYNVPFFKENKYPADNLLYEESLRGLKPLLDNKQPFFYTMLTATTHSPYKHPELRTFNHQLTWDWALKHLNDFYLDLKKLNFFDNGILIIVGDHRGMHPFREDEAIRYGESLRARVPLLLIGKDVEKNKIDSRSFQQADLFRKLNLAITTDLELSPHPIFVERYTKKEGKLENRNKLIAFQLINQTAHSFPIRIDENNIIWEKGAPENRLQIEEQIVAQQITLQQRN